MSARADDEALERVLGKVEGVTQRGGYWMARCPAHEDDKASLKVMRGTTQPVVLKCFAGCETEEDVIPALVALGVPRDVISAPREERAPRAEWTPAGPAVEIYDYRDEKGTLRFQVCRTADKQFRQRQPDPAARSGWRWKMDGVRLVPYHLPQLIAGIAAGQTIFCVEGEKDVHAVERAGGVATCNPGGAGKWRDEYAQYFHGADVVVVADKDEPAKNGRRAGADHAADVAASLRKTAKSIAVAQARVGKDAYDHLAAGHGLDAFNVVRSEPAARSKPDDDSGDGDSGTTGRGPSIATVIVRYAEDNYTFYRDQYDEPYALPVDGPRIARYLRGARSLRAELSAAYLRAEHKPANGSALADALGAIEGLALTGGVQHTYLRAARDGDSVAYLDLGRDDGAAVHLAAGAWQPVAAAPVVWRRTRKTRWLPDPVPGGDLGELWKIARVPEEERPLVVAWQLCALLDRAAPILDVIGEHGSGKTSAARAIACPVDTAMPATVPTNLVDLVVGAHARWITIIDNLSHLQPWLANALCRLVTGDEMDRRMLWTDSDVATLKLRRPIITTSIALAAVPPDYADRRVSIHVPVLDETEGMSESKWEALLARAQPEIMGAVLDIASKVLTGLPGIKLDRTPRMGDYAELLAAVDQVLGPSPVRDRDGQKIGEVTGLHVYRRQRGEVAAETVDSDPVGHALTEWFTGLAAQPDFELWRGSMSTLFAEIAPDPLPSQGWPKTPKGLSSRLTTLAPSLRKVGIEVSATAEKEPGTRRTIWRVHKVPAQSFARFNPSETGADQGKRSEGSDEGSCGGAPDPSSDPSRVPKDRSGQLFDPSQSFGLGTASDLRIEGSKDLKDCAGTSVARGTPGGASPLDDDGRVMALLRGRLGAELIETPNGHGTITKPADGDDRPQCIAPGCTAKARRACSTCPDHMELEPRRRAS